MKVNEALLQQVFEAAKAARENAYAVYSGVKVGAAIKLKNSEQIFAGCNVEFVVNGISVCAERNALGNIVTSVGKPEIDYIVVCSNTEPVLYPCGVCLQALSEFCTPELDIYVSNPSGIKTRVKYKELFTHQYSELPKVLD